MLIGERSVEVPKSLVFYYLLLQQISQYVWWYSYNGYTDTYQFILLFFWKIDTATTKIL